MKNKLFYILIIMLLTFNVNAEKIKVKEKEYYKNIITGCNIITDDDVGFVNENKIIISNYINEDVNNMYIYNYSDKCINATTQDLLDYYNNYTDESDRGYEDGFEIVYKVKLLNSESFYIKNDKPYDENESYYELDEENEEFHMLLDSEVNKQNINNYYIEGYFKLPSSAILDANQKYYVVDENVSDEYAKVFDGDVTKLDPLNAYILINKNDIEVEKKIVAKLDSIKYDEVTTNPDPGRGMQIQNIFINDKYYLGTSTGYMQNLKVYDANLTEIKEYAGKRLSTEGNYVLLEDYANKTVKIMDFDFNVIDILQLKDNENSDIVGYNNSLLVKINNKDDENASSKIYTYYRTDIMEGENQTYEGKDLSFRFSIPLGLFRKVKIDGNEITSDNYTISEGSTIVTLKKDYLDTLEKGTHDIITIFDGDIEFKTSFVKNTDAIKKDVNAIYGTKNENIPNTLDSYVYYALGLISIIGLSVIGKNIYNKRKRDFN